MQPNEPAAAPDAAPNAVSGSPASPAAPAPSVPWWRPILVGLLRAAIAFLTGRRKRAAAPEDGNDQAA